MEELTKSRLVGIALLGGLFASIITSHALIAGFIGIASGAYLAGMAVRFYEEGGEY